MRQRAVPGFIASQTVEPIGSGLPRAIAPRQVQPAHAGARLLHYAVDGFPVVTLLPAASPIVCWQQRHNDALRLIRQFTTTCAMAHYLATLDIRTSLTRVARFVVRIASVNSRAVQ